MLLFSVSYILKRNSKFFRLLLGSLVGSISIISLFISFSTISLFILKIIISIFMILIVFGFKNIRYFLINISYLYLLSIILGGFLYFINDSFAYKTNGFIFYNNGFSINVIIMIIISPIILFYYIKKLIKQKENLNNRYNVEITLLNNKKLNLIGYLDTGNNLYDPYKKRPILIINSSVLKDYNPRFLLVPCFTINKTSMIKCFKIKEIIIDNKLIKDDVLVGISDNKFNFDDVDLLLNKKILGRWLYEKNN